MKGLLAVPSTAEARQRSTAMEEDTDRRKPTKSKSLKLGDKCKILSPDRYSACKFEILKTALIILTCCTVVTVAFSPVIRKIQLPRSSSRFVFVSWKASKLSCMAGIECPGPYGEPLIDLRQLTEFLHHQ